MKILDKYASWAAMQYKDKVGPYSPSPPPPPCLRVSDLSSARVCSLSGQLTAICSQPPQEWSPSAPPPPSSAPAAAASSRPTSAQGTRKPRGFGNGSSGLSRETEGGGFEDDEASRRKAANEDFFATMGSKNEGRRDDLPPSQGEWNRFFKAA